MYFKLTMSSPALNSLVEHDNLPYLNGYSLNPGKALAYAKYCVLSEPLESKLYNCFWLCPPNKNVIHPRDSLFVNHFVLHCSYLQPTLKVIT